MVMIPAETLESIRQEAADRRAAYLAEITLVRTRAEAAEEATRWAQLRLEQAREENERLRDCLQSIRDHVAPHAGGSALAKAVVATCDSGLAASHPSPRDDFSEANDPFAGRAHEQSPLLNWPPGDNPDQEG